MTQKPASPIAAAQHRLRRMSGRDPHEANRASSPLELLYDLTTVIGFGAAASEMAHYVAAGNYLVGLGGFAIAMLGICWAWVNYSWFSSAYDTDDWIFRIATMVQMVGVVVLALGIPHMFESIAEGEHLGGGVMVLGYIIMRLSMVFLWLRAAKQDPTRRKTAFTYAAMIFIAQIGWTAMALADPPLPATLALLVLLFLVEFAGPYFGEGKEGGTPWHAHHIADRYSGLAIIGLGEGVVGTVESVSAVVQEHGWSLEAIMICAAGTGLTFCMWWIYFLVPWGKVLHAHRERVFPWAYAHILMFAAIAATGAGLHAAGYFIEHKATISETAIVAGVAVPIAIYIATLFTLYAAIVNRLDRFHLTELVLTLLAMLVAVYLAHLGVGLPTCLAILTIAPAVSIIGYEIIGYRNIYADIDGAAAD